MKKYSKMLMGETGYVQIFGTMLGFCKSTVILKVSSGRTASRARPTMIPVLTAVWCRDLYPHCTLLVS